MALTTVRPDGVGFDTGRRNMLINGGMLVSQRGTTFSETTAASYTTDRWLRHVGSSFNFDTTITQSTTVPAGTGLTHSLKVEADAAVTPSGSDNAGMGQRIEGDDCRFDRVTNYLVKPMSLLYLILHCNTYYKSTRRMLSSPN